MTVTFFGHSNAPDSIYPIIENILIQLIETEGATLFYVGNHGNFDHMVHKILKRLSNVYTQMNYSHVLAYLPEHVDLNSCDDYSDTIFPDKAAIAIPKFAITARNRWMLEQSDIVITYVTHTYGGAWTMKKSALAKKKRVIEISKK